jgi:hypothetical protein
MTLAVALPGAAMAISPSEPVARMEFKSGHETRDTGLFGDYWWANRFEILDETGWVPKSIMPDGLHTSDGGYEIWMNALKPITTELRQNSKSENSK